MIVQPYRPVTYTIGSANSGMSGMGNDPSGMHMSNMPGMHMSNMPGMGKTSSGMPSMSHMPGMNNGGKGMPAMPAMPGMGTVPPQISSGSPMTPAGAVLSTAAPVFEQSYIENILRLNLGKMGTFYMTYENNQSWNAKIFKGILEAAGRDHIIISDPATCQRVILLMVNFDYATFDEPLTYEYPGVIGNPLTPRW